MKTIGIIPARMAASRFPGKPLHPIAGRPMLEHCYLRADLYERWDELYVATCDTEIQQFCAENKFNCVMTSDQHSRALDRVAEAADILVPQGGDNDIVVCVQGDEPLLGPDAIGAVIEPLKKEPTLNGTLLAVDILDEETYQDPDIVKTGPR